MATDGLTIVTAGELEQHTHRDTDTRHTHLSLESVLIVVPGEKIARKRYLGPRQI
jgi:hypothetical protein